MGRLVVPKVTIGSSSKALVVFGHGLGDTPSGWEDVCQMWSEKMPHVKFILPEAPVQPVTMNHGHKMTSWYDMPLEMMDDRTETPTKGIEDSAEEWETIVKQEGDMPVVLAGFSQGGAMALYTASRGNLKNIAGVLSMSGYLTQAAAKDLKFPYNTLLCHGTDDAMVKYMNAEKSRTLLQEAGAKVELKTYRGMGHSALPQEIADIEQWLLQVLPERTEL